MVSQQKLTRPHINVHIDVLIFSVGELILKLYAILTSFHNTGAVWNPQILNYIWTG